MHLPPPRKFPDDARTCKKRPLPRSKDEPRRPREGRVVMSREKQGSSGPRDSTLARLVADALESQSAAASSDACPDADLLAAYADHALPDEEVSHWDSHFADCARCQKVLAVLTIRSDDPLTQQEIP